MQLLKFRFRKDFKMTAQELTEIIRRCEADGYHVVAINCDQEPAHQGLATALGITPEKTWFPHPFRKDEKIFFFFDCPHILKNGRNHVRDTTFIRCTFKFI